MLEKRIAELEDKLSKYEAATTIPFNVEAAFKRRLRVDSVFSALDAVGDFMLAITAGIGLISYTGSAFQFQNFLSGTKTYYVSDTSGGAVTRKLTFTNGVLTAEV